MKPKQEIAVYISSMNPAEFNELRLALSLVVEVGSHELLTQNMEVIKNTFGIDGCGNDIK